MISPTGQLDAAALQRSLERIAGVRARRDEPLARHVTMGVGGPADIFLEVENVAALAEALRRLNEAGVPWMMLGGGSNTLFEDAGFRGAVIDLKKDFRKIEEGGEPGAVRAGAGANLRAIMRFAVERGLTGLEFCVGIPGTLGGALAGNAGAGGEDICSVTRSVEVLGEGGEVRTLRRGEFQFAYRLSDLRRHVILGATLELHSDGAEAIQQRLEAHRSKRDNQPLAEKSAGCMFKNPAGDAAGRLIDATGLKGLRVGGIRVSEMHANFMVNGGTGTAADIRALMETVRRKVLEQTGVELESEVRIIPPGGAVDDATQPAPPPTRS